MLDPLAAPSAYQVFVYSLLERYPTIQRSTLVYIASGALFGRVEGRIFFAGDIVFCVQEYLNFELNVIEGYGYEVSHALVDLDAPGAPNTEEYCRASDVLAVTIPTQNKLTQMKSPNCSTSIARLQSNNSS